jgi:hypothetical protein
MTRWDDFTRSVAGWSFGVGWILNDTIRDFFHHEYGGVIGGIVVLIVVGLIASFDLRFKAKPKVPSNQHPQHS